MKKIIVKKYQPGGSISSGVAKGVKSAINKYKPVGKPIKKSPKPKRAVDLSAPGDEMMRELQKKGAMPASKTNIGRRGIKVGKAKGGKQMIKRADGSYSQRGLWDNIRANRGSGKKPTAQMLKQEKKIKSQSKKKK
jgi:hypothetical protein